VSQVLLLLALLSSLLSFQLFSLLERGVLLVLLLLLELRLPLSVSLLRY